MSPLSALLTPLQTLPGFPEAPVPGVLDILWFVLIIPGSIAVVIMALTMGRSWAGKRADDDDPHGEFQGARARERAELESH